MEKHKIAAMIDHTILKANATQEDIEKLCREAITYGFATVCVNSSYVPLAYRVLGESTVKVCTVVGFPLGATTTEVKAYETAQAVKSGAEEIDMVIHLGSLKSGDLAYVETDIAAVVKAAGGRCVKVIIETCYLNREEKEQVCRMAQRAGAHYLKTATGFGTGGATVDDIVLMRQIAGTEMGVKASGGIKSLADAERMIMAGASRIGTSSGVQIMGELEKT